MRTSRALVFIALFILAAGAAWWYLHRSPSAAVGEQVTVYYTKTDGTSEVPWTISFSSQHRDADSQQRLAEAVSYVATQALAGPPSGVEAIRFPAGTRVRALHVDGQTVDIDLSGEVKQSAAGGFAESGEFKALVWSLTNLPGITAVRVRVEGQTLATLPGGHLELDAPLTRASW